MHPSEFDRGGLSVLCAHHRLADTVVADKPADVDRGAALLQGLQEVAVGAQSVSEQLYGGTHRCRRTAAVANDVSGGSLADRTLSQAVFQQRAVAVGVHIDEARADDPAGCVDGPFGVGIRQVTDRRHPVSANAQVVAGRTGSAAGDDRAAADHDIETGRGRKSGRCGNQATGRQLQEISPCGCRGHLVVPAVVLVRWPITAEPRFAFNDG